MRLLTKGILFSTAVLALSGCVPTKPTPTAGKAKGQWVRENNPNAMASARRKGWGAISATPVFGRIVTYSLPKRFRPVFENTHGIQYIQEAVPAGESTGKWTQMITLTGAKGVAAVPSATPRRLVMFIAGSFKRNCPDSFSALGLGDISVDKHQGFGAIVGCGTSGRAHPAHSEMALVVAFSGHNNLYTLQWAERGAAIATPQKIDRSKWGKRLHELMPIRLCKIKPGEAPPYPSCINQ